MGVSTRGRAVASAQAEGLAAHAASPGSAYCTGRAWRCRCHVRGARGVSARVPGAARQPQRRRQAAWRALSASARPLAAHLPAGSAVSVGADDTVWVAGGGQLRDYPQGGKPQSRAIPLSVTDPVQATMAGGVPVAAPREPPAPAPARARTSAPGGPARAAAGRSPAAPSSTPSSSADGGGRTRRPPHPVDHREVLATYRVLG